MLAFFLLHLDKLHVEDESCEGRDGLSCAALAVAESVRNEEAILGTLLHELQTFGPSCDHAVQGELGGFAALYRAVEHCSVDEHALIVTLHGVGGLWLAAVAFLEHLLLETAGQRDDAVLLCVLSEIVLAVLLHSLEGLSLCCTLLLLQVLEELL